MFTKVLLSALLLFISNAEVANICNSSVQYSVRCSDEPRGSVVTVRPAVGSEGSYDVEYCGPAAPRPSAWQLAAKYLDVAPERCNESVLGHRGARGLKHSQIEFKNLKYNLTCTRDVCFTQRLDLMFRSCYRLENKFTRASASPPDDTYHYIDNNITGPEHYNNKKPYVHNIQHDTFLSFSWYPGPVPLTHYSIEVCRNESDGKICSNACTDCTRVTLDGRTQLSCRLPLSRDCYSLQLTHHEPWTNSIVFNALKNSYGVACQEDGGELSPLVADNRAWWAGGVAAVLIVGTLAALLARQSRYLRKVQQRARDHWFNSRQLEAEPRARRGAESAGPRRILLLYARDAAAARLVAALRAALETIAPGQVYDLFSAGVTALAGGAAHAWVEGALRDMRVVLLQLPALRALHDAGLCSGDVPRLSEPLLARTVRRAPVFGDALLQYALRLLSDTHAAAPLPYHRYYLATLSELPEDLFPYVTPFRRYELPAATSVLLRDLSDAPDAPDTSADLLEELAAASRDLAQFVRDNTNYFEDELLMLK